ncbi:unnamed protein product [Paramecium sonneborni]|uniref:Uncharacterized protein n=1 Tax=Paramecium sonneborni TaxID=65129 RepID=A0A8S1LZU6_9CILI|nr:unnamed protein product [Paramecium sonneborni]
MSENIIIKKKFYIYQMSQNINEQSLDFNKNAGKNQTFEIHVNNKPEEFHQKKQASQNNQHEENYNNEASQANQDDAKQQMEQSHNIEAVENLDKKSKYCTAALFNNLEEQQELDLDEFSQNTS